jgi:hypothetical protein
MQAALEPFRYGYTQKNAWMVANFFAPEAPPEDPVKLYDFYRASNEHQLENDIRAAIKYRIGGLSQKECAAWVDILATYWRAVGEILRAEEAHNQGRLSDRQQVDVYETWKEMTNHIVRHITNGSLPPWTIICMYTAANNLRLLAIKADEQLAKAKGNVTFSSSFQDDIVSTVPRNEKLEEAARVFNRMFALCLGDRYLLSPCQCVEQL